MRNLMASCRALVAGGVLALLASSTPAHAATIWTDWQQASAGGVAVGTLPGVTVGYSGELDFFTINGTSGIWSPDSSFIGGTVTTSPSTVRDELDLNGSFTGVNTINFSAPVENPVFAIWSLGQPGLQASFNFIGATPVVQAGGPNSQFGGNPIFVIGNSVFGFEGNGVVQFNGTFTQLQWTNSFEHYYAFTVGVNGPAAPEPMTLSLLGMGLAGAFLRRRRRNAEC